MNNARRRKIQALAESVTRKDLATMLITANERINDLERELQECRGGQKLKKEVNFPDDFSANNNFKPDFS